MNISKPNFFIVGAAKSGTTSLWEYLRRHPDVYMPEDELYKEPCYFSTYGEAMGRENYLSLFASAKYHKKLVGEASTAYLTDKVSAQRIFDFNPEAKIIIVLRNPVKRAYSLYNWMVQDGYEYAFSFEKALALEVRRSHTVIPNYYEPQYYWNYMYFQSGLYYEQVKRYVDLFGQQVLILRFEELVKMPQSVYDRCCSFLGIEPVTLEFSVHNSSNAVLSSKIQFIVRYLNGLMPTSNDRTSVKTLRGYYRDQLNKLSAVTHISWHDRIVGEIVLKRIRASMIGQSVPAAQDVTTKQQRDSWLSLGLSHRKPGRMPTGVEAMLLQRYSEDIVKLSNFLNWDLTGWSHG